MQANFPQKGKLYITTPIYLLYKSKDGKQYTLVKALQKSVDVPKETIPAINPVPGKIMNDIQGVLEIEALPG